MKRQATNREIAEELAHNAEKKILLVTYENGEIVRQRDPVEQIIEALDDAERRGMERAAKIAERYIIRYVGP